MPASCSSTDFAVLLGGVTTSLALVPSPWIANDAGSGVTICAAGISAQPRFAIAPPTEAARP